MQVYHRFFAAGGEAAVHGGLFEDLLNVLQLEVHSRFTGQRQQVKNTVG